MYIFYQGLKGITNVYTQHQPEIYGILADLLKGKTISL